MTQCSYKIKYFDYNRKEPLDFECTENASNSGFCIFHDKKVEEKTLEKKILEKINTLSKNEPLFCIGYKIPNIHLSESFSAPVYFTRAEIQNGDFTGTKFQNVDFSGSVLQNCDFSGVTFENADFLAVQFNKTCNFSKTVFKNKVNFSESIFEYADFNGSILKKAEFIGSKFTEADFSLAKIEDSDFFGVIFEKGVMFVGTDMKRTIFPKVIFNNNANFTGAKLTKTNFRQCTFDLLNLDNSEIQVVVIQGCTFSKGANFSSSNLDNVDCLNVNFKENANFSESNLQNVSFSGKTQGKCNFVKTRFINNIKFTNFEFNQCDFSDAQFQGISYFNDVQFKNQENVNFKVDDLSKVSFKNTDITHVRFGENVKWAGKDGFTVIDEERLGESPTPVDLESLITIYRNLRINYDNRSRYEEADKFLAKEIKLTKKYYELLPESFREEKEILKIKLQELKELYQRLEDQLNRLEKLNEK